MLVAAAFPQGCHVCRGAVRERAYGVACAECWNDGRTTPLFTRIAVCERCGMPGRGRCLSCAPGSITAVRSVGAWAGALRAALLDAKRRPRIAPHVADLVGDVWDASPCLHAADVIVPVPLHPERLAERGHNQAEAIARAVGRRAGCPVDAHALARTRAAARRRFGAGRDARAASSADAFAAAARLVRGRCVLLVDDLFTTGATLEACGRALRRAGAADVVALTAARVVLDAWRRT